MSPFPLCMKFLCVSKTQVVRHKYLKSHINTERLWPDPHCHWVCQQHPAFLLFLLLLLRFSTSSCPLLFFLSSCCLLLWALTGRCQAFPTTLLGGEEDGRRPSRCLQLITTAAEPLGVVRLKHTTQSLNRHLMSLLFFFCFFLHC